MPHRAVERFGTGIDLTPPTFQGFMGKREPQKILKTDERNIHIELGCEGKFTAKSSGWDEDRVFFEATSSSSRSRAAAGC